MEKIAKFTKVSFEQFEKDFTKIFPTYKNQKEMLLNLYESIPLPKRATNGSAGYDIYSPVGLIVKPGETVTIPTGIRVYMDAGWVLKIYPRSSFGFKYRAQLDNTVGIIDQDYYYANNEGHIMIKITNDTKEDKTMTISFMDRIVQGIFEKFGITVDDDEYDKSERTGGFGSTN